MLVSSKYEGKREIKRRGIATKLLVGDIKKGTELVVDVESKVLKLEEGKATHVIVNRFGVIGSAKVDMFFVNGGMVVEIKKGMVVVDLGKDSYAKVTKNSVEYVDISTEKGKIDSIDWIEYDGLINSAKLLIGHKYNLDTEMVKDLYVHNLAYNLQIDEGTKYFGNWWLTLKFVNFYTDLGLGEFEFDLGDAKPVAPKPKRYKPVVEEEVEVDDAIVSKLVGVDDSDDE